jgi:CBS domain-containing protein
MVSGALGIGRLRALPDLGPSAEDAAFEDERFFDDFDEPTDGEARGLRDWLERLFAAALGAVHGAAAGWADPSWTREAPSEGLATEVEAVMSRTVDVVGPDASLDEAVSRLWERDCGALPVVDPQTGRRVVGMVTDRDLCIAAWSRGVALRDLRVGEVMTRNPVVVRVHDSLGEAHRRMREHRIRRLPVIDDEGGLVGVVALADLVRHALRAAPEERSAAACAVLETLGAICTPHEPA